MTLTNSHAGCACFHCAELHVALYCSLQCFKCFHVCALHEVYWSCWYGGSAYCLLFFILGQKLQQPLSYRAIFSVFSRISIGIKSSCCISVKICFFKNSSENRKGIRWFVSIFICNIRRVLTKNNMFIYLHVCIFAFKVFVCSLSNICRNIWWTNLGPSSLWGLCRRESGLWETINVVCLCLVCVCLK